MYLVFLESGRCSPSLNDVFLRGPKPNIEHSPFSVLQSSVFTTVDLGRPPELKAGIICWSHFKALKWKNPSRKPWLLSYCFVPGFNIFFLQAFMEDGKLSLWHFPKLGGLWQRSEMRLAHTLWCFLTFVSLDITTIGGAATSMLSFPRSFSIFCSAFFRHWLGAFSGLRYAGRLAPFTSTGVRPL